MLICFRFYLLLSIYFSSYLFSSPYALLGYSWFGCTNDNTQNPRAPEWDNDYGVPIDEYCYETSTAGVFTRHWTNATVVWDCNARHGQINPV